MQYIFGILEAYWVGFVSGAWNFIKNCLSLLWKDNKAKIEKSKSLIIKRLFSNGIQKSKVQYKGIIAGVVPMGKKMVIYLFIWKKKSHRLEIFKGMDVYKVGPEIK